MNSTDRTETMLEHAFATAPSGATFATVDHRVAAAMAHPTASRTRFLGRRTRLPLALAAAFVVLAGATVAAVHLLDQVASTGDPGAVLAWERSIPIDQRQVRGDVALTLVRGYVDTSHVVLGLSMERVSGWGPRDMLNLELRDPAGVWLPVGGGGGGLGATRGTESVEIYSFAPPTVTAGEYTLQAETVEPAPGGPGPWLFRFTLPEPAGVVIAGGGTAKLAGGSIDLGEVRIAPTMITANMVLHPTDDKNFGWAPVGSIRHGDDEFGIAWSSSGASDTEQRVGTYEGSGAPSGTWTITVTELVGVRPDLSQIRLQGPWVFTVEVP
jgi:hypothetical protein